MFASMVPIYWRAGRKRIGRDEGCATAVRHHPAIEFELEKAERGMGLPYDAERVMQLRNMLREARKRKLSRALAAKRELPQDEFSACRV